MIEYFIRAATAAEAVKFREAHSKAVYTAGSTDIGVKLYKDSLSADGLIDISNLSELKGIDPESRSIGALTTFADILRARIDTPELRLMKQMAGQVAAAQIRNRATLGGNIANANPAADSLPVLAVLNASVLLLSTRGEQELPLSEYLKLRRAGDSSALLSRVRYEALPEKAGYAFFKVGRRENLAISRISGCAALTVEEGLITWVRLSLGAVSPVTDRFRETEAAILGRPFCRDTFVTAGIKAEEEAAGYIGGRSSAEYKLPVIRDLVPRLLSACKNESEGAI